MPRTIRSSLTLQLILLAVLPAVVATTGVVLLLSIQHLRTVDTVTQANAQTAARQLAGWAREPLANMERRALLQVARTGTSQAQIQQVQIWSAEGELLASSSNGNRDPQPGLRVMAPIDRGSPGAQIAIEFSLASVHAAQRNAWLNMMLALAVSLLGVALAGTWAARRISAPVRELATAVDRLGAGEPARVDPEGTAEIRQLQKGFNKAAAALLEGRRTLESRIQRATAELERKNRQIELASQAKTRLLAAASHDLRQPLHALTLFSEGLASGETDPVRLQRLRYVRECVESLDNLFSELLNISQIDAGVLKPQRSDFAFDRLFDDVSRNFRPVAEAKDLRLIVRHTDLWVNADYYMLSRIVSNLVANAVRYTHGGGVLLGARRRGTQVRIDVVDTGIGIAPEHQGRIFEEFYQLESRAGAKDRGMGLGLATVQRLTALLDAQVQLSSAVGRGTWIRVSVPAALPHREVRTATPSRGEQLAATPPRQSTGAEVGFVALA